MNAPHLDRTIAFALLALAGMVHGAPSAEDAQFFAEKVGPLLEQRCFECHSHQAGKMKGGLTLDSRSGWVAGGDDGPVIVPGDLEKSLLINAIRHTDPDLKMPKEKMPAAEIAVLEEWVKRGAPDPRETAPAASAASAISTDWWSLRPLMRPVVPETQQAVDGNPIDAFIAQELAKRGLPPSPEADPRALIRRVHYDLTGLPPSPAEVEAFGREHAENPDAAVRQLVDRLLASPRYGERWARHWFDVIHFADTHGFEHDVFRPNAWRYRDYVIESFNRDTPWPRFIREQLAADVFFPDEPRLTVALGYLGAGTYDMSAAGTAPMSFEYLDRDDLVTQTMTSFVSTTANCARCHAHKFDPVPQEDYFALQAVFAGIGKGDVSFDEDAAVAAQRRHWHALQSATGAALGTPGIDALVLEWETARNAAAPWTPLEIETFVSAEGATIERLPDGSLRSGGSRPDKETTTLTATTALGAITALRLELFNDEALPMAGPGRADNGNVHLTEFEVQVFRPGSATPEKLAIRRASADFEQAGYISAHALDGDIKTSWAIHPKVGEAHHAVFEFAANLTLEPGAKLGITLKQLQGGGHLLGRWRLSATTAPGAAVFAVPAAVEAILRTPNDSRTPAQRLELAGTAVKLRATEELARLPAQVKVFAAAARAENERGVITYSEPRAIHLLARGDLGKPGPVVMPGTLSAVTALPARFESIASNDERLRRAALADWLAAPENPLTWRSLANRIWHSHFGRGLCDTPNDFGRMGGTPSHPALLDWLASELRDKGGSLKQLHRLICTSAVYRQASGDRVDAAAIDPENRLLWRMNRKRLDAEEFRDTVLAASGSLDLSMGGPGIAQFISSKGPQATPKLDYSAFQWDAPGAGRRSIYRVVWRGIGDPFMDALDFPDAATLTPGRSFSSSPLQALALLNNDFVLHHSERFAARTELPGSSLGEQVRIAVRIALLREPTPDELAEFTAFAQKHSLAAVCRLLFNSNEFLFVN